MTKEFAIAIREVHIIEDCLEELSDLLIDAVDGGASIGFLAPLSIEETQHYWQQVLGSDVILLVANVNGSIVGTVQVHLSRKPNGSHRCEIAKLMVGGEYRGQGIGRLLMEAAEERAKQEGRTLIVLDTRAGDPSNNLYTSLHFVEAGRIPSYARSSNGELDATVFYYKLL